MTDKQHLGTWNNTGTKLLARTFDEGSTFIFVEQKEGPSDTVDVFVLRDEAMLDRDDVTLVAGLDVAATKAAITDHIWGDGFTGGPEGLGYKTQPTNFTVPNGYAKIVLQDGTIAYQKAAATSTVKTVAGTTTAGAAEEVTGWKKYSKWIIGGVIVLVGGAIALFSIRKKNGKK